MRRRPLIPQLVIAGGPGSGKDKIIAMILARYPGLFHLLGETAGMFIRAHSLKPPFVGEDLLDWQVVISTAQELAERMGQIMAARMGGFVLCNRGGPDGAGYLPLGWQEFLLYVGGTQEDHFAPYDMVVFLETPDEETYVATTAPGADGYNEDRFEDYAQAAERGARLQEVWSHHPDYRGVPAQPTIEAKFALVCGHIDDFLRRHGRL